MTLVDTLDTLVLIGDYDEFTQGNNFMPISKQFLMKFHFVSNQIGHRQRKVRQ